jgi:hypothetical protein
MKRIAFMTVAMLALALVGVARADDKPAKPVPAAVKPAPPKLTPDQAQAIDAALTARALALSHLKAAEALAQLAHERADRACERAGVKLDDVLAGRVKPEVTK